jgi:hypothetical protein
MLKIKPPTHKIDAGGTFISLSDPAWDQDKYAADMAAYEAAALTEVQDAAVAKFRAENQGRELSDDEIAAVRAACVLSDEERHKARGRHVVFRYLRGKTRMQPNAPDWGPDGKPCTARDYLKGPATEFSIRRLAYRDYQAADEIVGSNARLMEFCRLGLKGIKSADFNWTAKGDETVPDDVMQVLHDANVALPLEIGAAVVVLCRPIDVEESFPSG